MEIVFGIPQRSILSPILLNIFLVDLFFTVYSMDIGKYTDDNTPHATYCK